MTLRKDEFARRRRQPMRMMGRSSIAILPTAPVRLRNNDVEYPYRPDSDFYYLTGFDEPEAVAVLVPGRPQGEYILFVRERDPARETWDGQRAGPEGAVRGLRRRRRVPDRRHRRDPAGPAREPRQACSTAMGTHPEFDQQRGRLGERRCMRTAQRPARARGIRRARSRAARDAPVQEPRRARTSCARRRGSPRGAHVRAMRACAPGMREYEIAAELLHEFRRHGADVLLPPIVGGGANACILHYRENDAPLRDGDLLLIDAGCEFDCYASDITRTFPVNGRFTPEQRALYEVVLDAQQAAIARVRPGNHWNDPHDAAVRAVTQGLVRARAAQGPRADARQGTSAYKKFFMHRTGHWLGLDVHDVGDYKVGDEWRRARARHGADGRARHLRRRRHARRAAPLARHRHAHRGRRRGHARRLRRAHRRGAAHAAPRSSAQ